jgi:multiple sugar transport system permease protein
MLSTVMLYIVATGILMLMSLPFYYLVIQSISPWNEVDRSFWPTTFTLRSYKWLLLGGETNVAQPWLRAFFNSLGVTVVSTACQVLIGMGVAYGLSVIQFKGAKVLKNFVLFQMFYPSIILLVPTFLLIRYTGLYNTFWAMVLPTTVSLFAIFTFSNFFLSIPKELIEAARLDGASETRIIFKVVLPMSRSIITVVSLFLFVERWSTLMWDLMVVKEPAKQTLNVLMATMFGPYGAYPGPLYASGVLLTLPLVILFLIFSRHFGRGVQFVIK